MALLKEHIVEPMEEQRCREAMSRLTAVEDAVSSLVQRQYEENPYPRWTKLPPARKVHSLNSHLRQQFPFAPFGPLGKESNLDILIAGCGTGQESIESARQFPNARVLAVDLSLSSLGYAKRKTDEAGIANIEYAQGDILKLGSIGRSFDMIASVGVLHHLANPTAGLRVLLSLLRPGGFMQLGLYSQSARRDVVAARAFIAERGYSSDVLAIRRSRQDLIENFAQSERLTSMRDFYVTSECRDLLFHVQEHRFTLPQIKEILGNLCLHFIGFQLEPHVIHEYRARFPDDKSKTNLDHWNDFEREFPDTFVGMYRFWVQKSAV
jgi:2-polyprenyl-3-methyl-5-hydroxy-6-metoxy-1,4-benzoquinol methylase